MADPVQTFVVYSPNEAFCNDGAGFWSDALGWSVLEHATTFSPAERVSFTLPQSAGNDARYVALQEAFAQYG